MRLPAAVRSAVQGFLFSTPGTHHRTVLRANARHFGAIFNAQRAALLEDSQALGLQRLDARCIRLRFVFFFGDLARMNSNQIGNDLARALVGDCDVAPVSPAPS